MLKKPLFQSIFWLIVIIFVLHYLSLTQSWYWIFWWMDVIMHFLGGLWIGLVMVLVLELGEAYIPFRHGHVLAFVIVIGGVMAVGYGWELFELYAGLFVVDERFPDTYHDLWMDLAGGLTAYTYALSRNYFHGPNTLRS